jgi:hypothetical protein
MKHQTPISSRWKIATVAVAVLAVSALTSCGSSSSDGSSSPSEDDSSNMSTDNVDSNDETATSGGDGTGTITIDGKTFTFDLTCAFGSETMNEDVSIGIIGSADDGLEMAFNETLGFDLSSAEFSKDMPPEHSITIYEMPGVVLAYEYLSMTDKLLDVSGKTVGGSVKFVKFENGEPTSLTPNFDGEVNLQCN